ncbi:MAG: ceramidase domain-containing protein [Thiotrichales bacterium]
MNTYLDRYCERVEPGLWAEPLNVVSNLAFLLAAGMLFRAYRAQPVHAPELPWLIGLVAAIGAGSGLWHLLARRWAEYADALPILAFIGLYFLFALYRLVTPVWSRVMTVWVGFHLLNAAVQVTLPAELGNGSGFYLPTWLTLLLLALYLGGRRHPQAEVFGWAALLFLLALGLRTVDLTLCPRVAFGTHFLWHLMTAGVLYLLVSGLIAAARRDAVSP